MLPPLRQPLQPGRSNLEQPGQGGTPLDLDRELRARFTVQLADYADSAPGMVRAFEAMRLATPLVAAQFSGVQLYNESGFYLEAMRNDSAALSVGVRSDLLGAQPAIATASGAPSRLLQLLAFPRLVISMGAFAAVTTGYYVNATVSIPLRIWVPGTHVLTLQGLTAGVATDLNVILSGPQVS